MLRLRPVPPPDRPADAGMVTAELAVTMPVLVLVLVTGMSALSLGTTQLRCADAAAAAARLAARGEPATTVLAVARAAAPEGADVVSRRTAAGVVVTVSASARLPGLGLAIPAFTVRESFSTPVEPADPDA
jgi:hypothetical protein